MYKDIYFFSVKFLQFLKKTISKSFDFFNRNFISSTIALVLLLTIMLLIIICYPNARYKYYKHIHYIEEEVITKWESERQHKKRDTITYNNILYTREQIDSILQNFAYRSGYKQINEELRLEKVEYHFLNINFNFDTCDDYGNNISREYLSSIIKQEFRMHFLDYIEIINLLDSFDIKITGDVAVHRVSPIYFLKLKSQEVLDASDDYNDVKTCIIKEFFQVLNYCKFDFFN